MSSPKILRKNIKKYVNRAIEKRVNKWKFRECSNAYRIADRPQRLLPTEFVNKFEENVEKLQNLTA